MELTTIRTSEIDTGPRIRVPDSDYVELLKASIAERGLMTPIEVRPADGGRYQLVAGAHRLAAVQALEWEGIPALVFDGSEDEAELRQIDENLCRHDLNELDRAAFLAARKVVYERLHPEAAHGRRKKGGMNATFSFRADAAAKLRLSESHINRLLRRHNALSPDVRRRIAGTALASSGGDLDALAKATHDEQVQAVVLMLGKPGEFPRAALALKRLRGRPEAFESPADKQKRKLQRLWDDVSPSVRRWFLDMLVAEEREAVRAALMRQGLAVNAAIQSGEDLPTSPRASKKGKTHEGK